MTKLRTVFGFDMETDVGSWTSSYEGFRKGTPRILDVLEKNKITATFYFTGDSAQKNPDIVKSVRSAGHEIGCHTLYHETIGEPLFEIPGMIPILPEEVYHRIELATQWVETAAGIRPTSFRSPRLFGSTAVVNALERLGYRSDASYPLYFFKKQLVPYNPSSKDWTEKGELNLIELPNFADLSKTSNDPYGRDLDQWPLWRLQNAEALMSRINGYTTYCKTKNVEPFLCFYFHPWEFEEMPQGLIHSGEGAVLPDPFIVKNCGSYALQEFDRLVQLLKSAGSEFYQAGQITVD